MLAGTAGLKNECRYGYAVSLPERVWALLTWVCPESPDESPEDEPPLELPPEELSLEEPLDELSKLEPLDLPLSLPESEPLLEALPEDREPLPVAPSGPSPLPDDSGTLARSLWTHTPSAR